MNINNHISEIITCKKYKLDLSKNDREVVDFWMRRCKYLYNLALEEKIIYYKYTNKYLNVYEQKKELVDIKEYDSSWKDIPNKSLQEIIFRVDKAFQAFFKGRNRSVGFPKFKKELNSIEFVKTDIRLKDGELYLPKIKNRIKTFEKVKSGYSSAKLVKENDNYYLVMLYKTVKEIELKNNDILGIDLGLKDLATDSNGNKIKRFSKKLISKYYKRIMILNQSLSRKSKGSIKFRKVKKNLRKVYVRLKNSKNDYLHKESLKIVRDSKESIISVGDIKIQNIISKSKKGLIKSFYINSLGMFKQMISYKSVKYDKKCLRVDERMTSKTCSCCGNVNYSLKLSDRFYKCLNVKCLNSIDRDFNSAINMKMLGSSKLLELSNNFVSLE